MSKRSTLVGAGALAASLLLPASATTAQEGLKDHEVQKLAGVLGDAVDTFDGASNKAREKARGKLDAELKKIGKKLGAEKGNEIHDALLLSSDIGRALAGTVKYKALAKGRVQGFKDKDSGLEYAAHAPRDYDPRKQSYPVVLIVPGLDDGKPMRPETLLQEHWLDATMREQVILIAANMPEDVATWTDGGPAGISTIMRTLAEVRGTFSIDYNRFYLGGQGIGVQAAVDVASRFPHLFAGVIGRAGDAGVTLPDNFSNLPTFFTGAGGQASAFQEKAQAAGIENCTVVAAATDADILTWIQANERPSMPDEVVLVPGSPIPNSAYWVQVPPTDAQGTARIQAKADRGNNTITVEGQGVTSVGILFNDDLVDLTKPVTLVLNGVSQEHVIPRSLDTTLAMIYRGKSDPGRIYTAFMSFDLPAEQ